MEAGYRFNTVKQSKMLMHSWDNDWETFKQKFEATADLNGLSEAVMAGQLLAEDKINWPWFSTKIERSDQTAISNKIMERATVQSRRLASMLILSLLDSTWIQISIVGGRLRYAKDGARDWADLITHFEMSSKDLRVENLTKKWDDAMLGVEEHSDNCGRS